MFFSCNFNFNFPKKNNNGGTTPTCKNLSFLLRITEKPVCFFSPINPLNSKAELSYASKTSHHLTGERCRTLTIRDVPWIFEKKLGATIYRSPPNGGKKVRESPPKWSYTWGLYNQLQRIKDVGFLRAERGLFSCEAGLGYGKTLTTEVRGWFCWSVVVGVCFLFLLGKLGCWVLEPWGNLQGKIGES